MSRRTAMSTFVEQIETLSEEQLRRLEAALLLLEGHMQSTTPSLEEMVAQLSPGLVLSPDAVDLIAARAYELSLTQPTAAFESLLAEALAEYAAGKLKSYKALRPTQAAPRRLQRRQAVLRAGPKPALNLAPPAVTGPVNDAFSDVRPGMDTRTKPRFY